MNINHISVTAAPEVISIINFVDKTAKIQTYPNYQEDFSTENVSYNLLESDHLFSTVENPALTSIWPKGYIEINYQNIPGSQPDNFSLWKCSYNYFNIDMISIPVDQSLIIINWCILDTGFTLLSVIYVYLVLKSMDKTTC